MSVVEFNELYSALERNDTNVIDRYLNADIARCVNLRYGQQHLLNAAARSGNAALVQRVLDLGVNVAAVEDWFGYTALHDAANSGDVAVVKALLAAGADPNARTHYGFAPLDVALNHGRDAVATLLEPLTTSPDAASKRRRAPAAVKKGTATKKTTTTKVSKKQQRDAVVVKV
jgi:ankyrin repeat protein